jgi:hypothetical protein
MSTLTDRYVSAALRGVPDKQRGDVEQELRASVADAIDGLVASGTDEPLAERQVLTDLGDPDRLAAEYADRPLQLIGPAVFLDYWRLLKVLLAVVVPIVAVAVTLVRILSADPIGLAVADGVGSALGTAMHIAFWTTLVFAILERSDPGTRSTLGTWSLDRLPEVPERRRSFADMVVSVTVVVLFIALIFVQEFGTLVNGRRVPVLNSDLWSSWLSVLVGLLVLEILLELVLYRVGRWTFPIAVANLVLNALVAGIVIALLQAGLLLNNAFFRAVGWPEGGGADGVIALLATVAMVVVAGISIVDGFYRAVRSR